MTGVEVGRHEAGIGLGVHLKKHHLGRAVDLVPAGHDGRVSEFSLANEQNPTGLETRPVHDADVSQTPDSCGTIQLKMPGDDATARDKGDAVVSFGVMGRDCGGVSDSRAQIQLSEVAGAEAPQQRVILYEYGPVVSWV